MSLRASALRGLFALIFAFAAAPSLPAQTAEQAVLAAEKAWSAALVAGDLAALERVMGEDLTYGHATGDIDSKASYMGRIRSGTLKYTQFAYDPGSTVRVFGNTAVLNGSAQVKSINDGAPSEPHLRFLHVYVRRGGRWLLVAHQSARLAH